MSLLVGVLAVDLLDLGNTAAGRVGIGVALGICIEIAVVSAQCFLKFIRMRTDGRDGPSS